MRKTRVAPAIVLFVAGLILLTGCKKPKPPTVTISAPTDSVAFVGDTVTFTATVTNPDNVKTTLNWSKTGGTLVRDTGVSVRWVAPADSGRVTISVIVTGEGVAQKDTASKTIIVKKWVHDLVDVDNIDHIDIPNPGDTFSPILLTNNQSGDDSVPPGALVDSVWAEIDVTYDGSDPDSFPPMNIWVKAPDGTGVQIWNDTQSGDPSGDLFPSVLAGLKDKLVTGTWKLEVQAQAGPADGWIDDFHLMVWYRTSIP